MRSKAGLVAFARVRLFLLMIGFSITSQMLAQQTAQPAKAPDVLARDTGDLDIEFSEAKMTLDAVTQENVALKRQLASSQESIKTLTDSLAISNSEAEVFRRECGALKLRMEALGIDAGGDRSKLEERLLKAVSDIRVLEDEKVKLTEQVLRLSEAIVRFVKTAVTTDADARMALEAEMRSASDLLGVKMRAVETAPVAGTLTDGMVISVKEEFALVVANLGSNQGVRIGMPFQVWRGDDRIGLVRVVDVREKIAGAVIQDLDSKEKIKVGDRLRVDAR